MNGPNPLSTTYFEEACQLFPGGVNSPVRAFRSITGRKPLFFQEGKKDMLKDVDGHTYIDYCLSWGPLINGHTHPYITERIVEALKKGSTFGAPTLLENQLAKTIIQNHPFIEKIRFVSSGTEAVMSILRLARGYTQRNKIIKFEGCYHGHSDAMLVQAGSGLATLGTSNSAGVPDSFAKETIVCHLGDKASVEKAFQTYVKEIAAIIIEPIPANNGLLLQQKDFLQFLEAICKSEGSLLIFDEVISGFRVGFAGAAGYYNIQPDLITFGKIMGGGLPAGAYAGKAEIMDFIAPLGPVYQAGTLSGNPLAMAAGQAQLELCLEKNFYKELAQKTNALIQPVNEFAQKNDFPFHIQAVCGIFWLAFDSRSMVDRASLIKQKSMEKFSLFYNELLDNGIYMGPSGYEVGFLSSVHSAENIAKTVEIFKKAIAHIYQSV